jgi:carbon-monoxide dehydrogenase large subunit
MERMMDLLADTLGKEADEVRRLINTTTQRFTSPLGLEIDASRPFFERAVAELQYGERSKRNTAGLSFFVLVPAVMPGGSARIRVRNGTVDVWLGENQHGQKHFAFVKRLLSEELGIAENLITLNNEDTAALKDGVGSWGNRSAIVGGAAVIAAARKLKSQVESRYGGYTAEGLLKDNFDAEVFDRHVEGLTKDSTLHPVQRALTQQLNSFGANLATISIDNYGVVRVKECAACYDVGKALSPNVVEGQIIGGSMQGIGQALYESVVHDSEDRLLTKDFFDAGVPIAENTPEFFITIVEHPSSFVHHAKGLGEAPTIGVPIAVVRSIEKLSGKRIRHTPVRPEEFIEGSDT